MSARERLLILFGIDGVEYLTNKARETIVAVGGCYAPLVVDETVTEGEKLGVLPSEREPLLLIRAARKKLALEQETLIVVDSVEAFLKEQRSKENG